MGFMNHGIQRQHDAGDLIHPCPRANTLKQASPAHIIYGPMAPLVDGVTLGMVRRGKQPLDPQGVSQLGPNFANKFTATV